MRLYKSTATPVRRSNTFFDQPQVHLRPALRLILCVCWLVLACSSQLSAQVEKQTVGVSIPLSGEAATLGIDYRNIYQFANRILANDRFNLIFEDDRCSGKDGVSVAQKFATINRVRFALGVSCDVVFSSAAPIYEKNGIVVISTSAVPAPGRHLFHSDLENRSWVATVLEHMRGRYHKVGVFNEEAGFPQGLADLFIKLAPSYGITVSAASFSPDTSDFVPALLALKNRGVEALFLLTQTEPAFVRLIQQVNKIHLGLQIYNAFAAGSATFLSAVGKGGDGILLVDFPPIEASLTPAGLELFKRYQAEFGRPKSVDGVFILAFEGFRAMFEASQAADPIAFLNSASFDGVAGKWHFGADGFWVGPRMVMKVVKNGVAELVKP